MPLHPNCQRVQEALAGAGLDCEVREFAESTRTAAEAASVLGVTVSEIAKSVVFVSNGDVVLVIACGTNRISEKKLEVLIGAPLKRADADFVKQSTGYPIGGVPPVAHNRSPRIFIDQDLLQFESVWAAAGTPRAVFRITTEDLVRVSGAKVADVKDG